MKKSILQRIGVIVLLLLLCSAGRVIYLNSTYYGSLSTGTFIYPHNYDAIWWMIFLVVPYALLMYRFLYPTEAFSKDLIMLRIKRFETISFKPRKRIGVFQITLCLAGLAALAYSAIFLTKTEILRPESEWLFGMSISLGCLILLIAHFILISVMTWIRQED